MNPIRRILAKLRRRKAKVVPLGRFFHQAVADFNNGSKIYAASHDSAGPVTHPVNRAGVARAHRTGAVT